MISLIFFFVIGLGLVIGAHLNAALAETPEERHAHRAEAKAEVTQ
jgi:membrane protein